MYQCISVYVYMCTSVSLNSKKGIEKMNNNGDCFEEKITNITNNKLSIKLNHFTDVID